MYIWQSNFLELFLVHMLLLQNAVASQFYPGETYLNSTILNWKGDNVHSPDSYTQHSSTMCMCLNLVIYTRTPVHWDKKFLAIYCTNPFISGQNLCLSSIFNLIQNLKIDQIWRSARISATGHIIYLIWVPFAIQNNLAHPVLNILPYFIFLFVCLLNTNTHTSMYVYTSPSPPPPR